MRRTPALIRRERKLAEDPCAILSDSEIRVLDREVRRALVCPLVPRQSGVATV